MDMILKNTFQSISPAYELIGDVTVGSNTTQVDFTGLNIGKDDELLLVSDVVSPRYNELNLYVNANYTKSQYYSQELCAVGTGYTSSRSNDSVFAYSSDVANKVLVSFNIKLTNSGHFIYLARGVRSYGGSAVALHEDYGTSTGTMSTITSLRIEAYLANGIEANSRFQLYKLVAEKVADIIVPSNTTSVDITGLDIGKDGEYYLVSDVSGSPLSNNYIMLYANDNNTATNYYSQMLRADNTNTIGVRYNSPMIAHAGLDQKMLIFSNIKLTDSGYIVNQSNGLMRYGGSTIELKKFYMTSTFTTSSITKLRIAEQNGSQINANSRFTLYKMK